MATTGHDDRAHVHVDVHAVPWHVRDVIDDSTLLTTGGGAWDPPWTVPTIDAIVAAVPDLDEEIGHHVNRHTGAVVRVDPAPPGAIGIGLGVSAAWPDAPPPGPDPDGNRPRALAPGVREAMEDVAAVVAATLFDGRVFPSGAYEAAYARWCSAVAACIADLADRGALAPLPRPMSEPDFIDFIDPDEHLAVCVELGRAAANAARDMGPDGWASTVDPDGPDDEIAECGFGLLAAEDTWFLTRCAPRAGEVAAVLAPPDDHRVLPRVAGSVATSGVDMSHVVDLATSGAPDAADVIAALATITR